VDRTAETEHALRQCRGVCFYGAVRRDRGTTGIVCYSAVCVKGGAK
jgi:hypothetical protein